ncbi:hypothetical protein KSX_95990 [Ktedonospora formicarum]|uniref:Uncharacterized protein n=1 Tax=Ktedonospora formicarum TaxID=2778364 RepID=A0A8J3ICD3_9CHLR|nr:hypothetical protein KSX_95990 [Ktedonospora formicarum]
MGVKHTTIVNKSIWQTNKKPFHILAAGCADPDGVILTMMVATTAISTRNTRNANMTPPHPLTTEDFPCGGEDISGGRDGFSEK